MAEMNAGRLSEIRMWARQAFARQRAGFDAPATLPTVLELLAEIDCLREGREKPVFTSSVIFIVHRDGTVFEVFSEEAQATRYRDAEVPGGGIAERAIVDPIRLRALEGKPGG